MRLSKFLIINLLLWPIYLVAQAVEVASESSAIEKMTQDYVTTFNRHDPEAISAYWTEDGEYINPTTGVIISGKKEITDELKKWFESSKVATIAINSPKITFPNIDNAIETGVLHLSFPDNRSKDKAFKAKLVKIQGKWLFQEIQQTDIAPEDDSHYEQLKELAWMVGDWEDAMEDVEIKSSISWWAPNNNYLIQKSTSKIFDQKSMEIRQLIGWDPDTKLIRSWVFDTDGGFGTGKWHKKGSDWHVNSSYTLPDGRKASAIHIYTKIDDNSFTWASEGRDIDGEILPNIPPIKIVRVTSQEVK